MDFSNTLPSDSVSPSEKSTPHISTGRHDPTLSPSIPVAEEHSCKNVRWTPARCARYDFYLHVVSLILGICTLVLYVFDLAKSASYHARLPVGLTIVDAMAIAFLCLSNAWSSIYLLRGIYTRMSQGEMRRKWPTIIDLALHCGLLGMADTTFSMRGGKGNCDKNRAVGGCMHWRRALMIAAGVLLILVGVAVQVRFAVTMHAVSERKRLEKATRRESGLTEADQTWSNTVR